VECGICFTSDRINEGGDGRKEVAEGRKGKRKEVTEGGNQMGQLPPLKTWVGGREGGRGPHRVVEGSKTFLVTFEFWGGEECPFVHSKGVNLLQTGLHQSHITFEDGGTLGEREERKEKRRKREGARGR
jgi:hypothetical protein